MSHLVLHKWVFIRLFGHMLFRTQFIFCSSELRLHFRIAEVGSLLSLNRAWRAHVTHE